MSQSIITYGPLLECVVYTANNAHNNYYYNTEQSLEKHGESFGSSGMCPY